LLEWLDHVRALLDDDDGLHDLTAIFYYIRSSALLLRSARRS
jgi:hypothetical protein